MVGVNWKKYVSVYFISNSAVKKSPAIRRTFSRENYRKMLRGQRKYMRPLSLSLPSSPHPPLLTLFPPSTSTLCIVHVCIRTLTSFTSTQPKPFTNLLIHVQVICIPTPILQFQTESHDVYVGKIVHWSELRFWVVAM